jgi:hypothetical protein
MAIKYIESISIDGKGNDPNRKLFNGLLYRLTYDISMGEGKSKITANIFSEDGTYTISPTDPNYTRVYPIRIGKKITVNAYLDGYKKTVDGESKVVELSFSDTSVKMDQYYVGLFKRMGLTSKGNILIVGREIHPCDRDYDGKIDSIQDLEDECHPCRNTAQKTAEQELVNCQELNKYAIFPVSYNFGELITELRKVFNIANPTDLNPKYRTTYTGTVREVLSQWCSDFGWTFYWENETIKFLDLRRTVNVAAEPNAFCPNLSAYEEEYTIEGTEDRILSSYYERPGAHDDYECHDGLYFSLPPYDAATGGISSELRVTSKIPKVAAGLMQYSERLRDLWYYYDYYSLRSASDYKIGKECQRLGLTVLSPAITLDFSPGSGNTSSLQIGSVQGSGGLGLFAPKGFPTDPEPASNLDFLKFSAPTSALQKVQARILSNPTYKMCFELLTTEDQWIVANGLAKNDKDFFFFIGFHEESAQDAYKQEEREFGSDFMGRYYVYQPNMANDNDRKFFEDYTFYQEKICNIQIRSNDNKINYNIINEGGGSGSEFYNNPGLTKDGDTDTLSKLPFAKWLRLLRESAAAATAGDRQRMFKLLVIEKQGELFHPSTRQVENDSEEGDLPPKDAIKNEKLINLTQTHACLILEQKNNQRGEFIPRKIMEDIGGVLNPNLDRSKVFIFLGRDVGKDNFRITKGNAANPANTVGMPFDGIPITTRYEDEFDIKGRVLYKYPDIKCKQIGNMNNVCYRVSFQTPEATFTYFEPTYSNYGVVVEKEKKIRRYPDKLQTFNLNKTNISSKVASLKVIQKDITDNDIAIFANKNNTCRYNLDKIKDFHAKFAQNLDFTFDKPIVSKSFTIEGTEMDGPTPNIENGLISIQIGMDENGIRSTYTYGTRLMRPISDEVLKAKELLTNTTKTAYGLVAPTRNSSNQQP